MNLAKRAALYVFRNRSKTALLFCILALSGLLIVSSLSIMQATELLMQDIEKNTGTKLHVEQLAESLPIPEDILSQVGELDNIDWVNRISQVTALPANFANIPGAETQTPEDAMVQFCGYDDIENDGPFANQLVRLESGSFFERTDTARVLLHSELAQANGLSVGDTIGFVLDGRHAEAEIAGIYALTTAIEVGDAVTSLYRPENQIYASQDVVRKLQQVPGYSELFCYLSDPSAAKGDMNEIAAIVNDDYRVSVFDALYNEVKGSLAQARRIVSLMLIVTIFVTAAVVSLMLSLWMRGRVREISVYISLGERKLYILLQSLLEVWFIVVLAVGITALIGNLAAQGIGGLVLPGTEMRLAVSLIDIAWLFAGGLLLTAIAVLLSLLPMFGMKPRSILTIAE
jgi:putative ABC transport system permease protein